MLRMNREDLKRTRQAPAAWVGAGVLCALVVCLALIGLPRRLANAPETLASDEVSVTATAGTVRSAQRPTGPIATVAALATAMVLPRTPLRVVPTVVPAATAIQQGAPAVATPQPTPTAGRTLQTILDERWEGSHRWPDDSRSTAWYTDGAYHLFARNPAQFVAVSAPLDAPLGDVVISGTFHKVGGPPGGGYGLIVHDQGPGPRDGVNQLGRFYVLEAGDKGEFGVWRRDGDRWIELIPWTPTDHVFASDG